MIDEEVKLACEMLESAREIRWMKKVNAAIEVLPGSQRIEGDEIKGV